MVTGVVVLIVSVFIAFLYIEQTGVAVRPGAAGFLLHRPTVRRGVSAGTSLAAGQRQRGRRHDHQRPFFLLLLQKGISLSIPVRFTSRRLWDAIPWLTPYKQAYQHSALSRWIFCMIVMIVDVAAHGSAAKGTGRADHLESQLPQSCRPDERQRYSGWKDFRIWWLLFVASVFGSTDFSSGSTCSR